MSVVFIAGLARSGTTFLQSRLLQHEKVVALGEVSQTIMAIKNVNTDSVISSLIVKAGLKSQNYWSPKTYGELLDRVKNDSFWSDVEKEIKATNNISEALDLVYQKATEKYPGHIIIDSSKHIGHLLNSLQTKNFKHKIKVLLCVRDYRGWLLSIKKHQKRAGLQTRSNIIEKYKWWYSNRKLLKVLQQQNQNNFLVVSYEKLIFYYDKVMNDVKTFTGAANISEIDTTHKFHEILGSQSLKKSMEGEDFIYDISWFAEYGNILEFPIAKFNSDIYLRYTQYGTNK